MLIYFGLFSSAFRMWVCVKLTSYTNIYRNSFFFIIDLYLFDCFGFFVECTRICLLSQSDWIPCLLTCVGLFRPQKKRPNYVCAMCDCACWLKDSQFVWFYFISFSFSFYFLSHILHESTVACRFTQNTVWEAYNN